MPLRKRKSKSQANAQAADYVEVSAGPDATDALDSMSMDVLDSMDDWAEELGRHQGATRAPETREVVEEPSFQSAPEPEPETHAAYIGESVEIKGELSGHQDIHIEGCVEGKISMEECSVTIGRTGRVVAEIFARSVIVQGTVVGNVVATDMVEISSTGSVEGDITSARVSLAEGCRFRGSIDMDDSKSEPEVSSKSKKAKTGSKAEPKVEAKPEPEAGPAVGVGADSAPEPEPTGKTSVGNLDSMF